jgi:hypothetical protein
VRFVSKAEKGPLSMYIAIAFGIFFAFVILQYFLLRTAAAEVPRLAEQDDVEYYGNVVVRGLGELRRLGETECGLVTILGAPKQGKSFLLNRLTESCQFVDNIEGGRGGINICHPISVESTTMPQTGGERGSTSEVALYVAFADTVQPGDSDASHLVSYMFPLSSVLIFNWMGRLQVDAILQQLGMFACRIMPLIGVNDESRRVISLHVVLRDIDQGTSENEMQMTSLLLQPESMKSSDDPSVKRNEIRATLKKTFRRIRVWAMPHPFVGKGTVRISRLFDEKVVKLRKRVFCQIKYQSDQGLGVVTGAAIADKLPFLLKVVSQPAERRMQIALQNKLLEEQLNQVIEEKALVKSFSEQSRLEDQLKYRRTLQAQKDEAARKIEQLTSQLEYESQVRNNERLAYQRKIEEIDGERITREQDMEKERRQLLTEKETLKQTTESLLTDLEIQRAANRELLRNTVELKKEYVNLEERIGGHLADWRWLGTNSIWQSYDVLTAEKIERAYIGQEGKVRFSFGRWNYEVDLSNVDNMTQTNLDTKTIRKVKRVKSSFVGYPDTWVRQTQDLLRVKLFRDEEEFKSVEESFHQSMSRTDFKIVGLQRIQHRLLWDEYQHAKQIMYRKNNGQINERDLFHGTSSNKPENLYSSEKGFDMRLAKEGMWGAGTYFAEKALYSDKYAYQEHFWAPKQIFLAKVLLGISETNACKDKDRKLPELLPPAALGGVQGNVQHRYDSLNGVTRNCRVYVIFDNGHAYPYYLIDYVNLDNPL